MIPIIFKPPAGLPTGLDRRLSVAQPFSSRDLRIGDIYLYKPNVDQDKNEMKTVIENKKNKIR